jgi:2,3-bisphosphoglycerate-dependent phosphoglycerate mutase
MSESSPTRTSDATSVPQPTLDPSVGDSCRVLLIRHGRSADIVPGSPESTDPPLHEEGVRQARLLGERLAKTRIDAVYSSHLLRALSTAEEVAKHHRLSVGIHEDLEEIRLGDWSNGEFRRRAASNDSEFIAWRQTGTWDGIPNGEGDAMFRQRVSQRIDDLASRHRGSTIAVVCHGGVINAYLAKTLGTDRSLWMMVENTSVTTVNVSETSHVIGLNDCSHLYDILHI